MTNHPEFIAREVSIREVGDGWIVEIDGASLAYPSAVEAQRAVKKYGALLSLRGSR